MATKTTSVDIIEVTKGSIEVGILGKSPLICNAMSNKVKQGLLFPSPRKNAAEKASSLKHDPISEFKSSMYLARDPQSPTRIVMKATAFKKSMMGAALDLPGSSKAQIGRLAWVLGDEIPIFGAPMLMMAVTRSADINKTPDVRTRAIIPQWACFLRIEYVTPILKETAIINLLAAAGMCQGIGDWRVEKGSGNFGQFELVSADDEVFKSIIQNGMKEQQDAAIAEPVPYDSETEELLAWHASELKRRGFKAVG